MHKDTPTEILHTILLGVVKYYWGQTIWLLENGKDFALFQTRLNSILEDGLNVPKIQADYMCQYKGGLIGKHFKTLSQVMAFAVHGLVPPDVLEAWLILGRLTVLLWHTEIEDIVSYTVRAIFTVMFISITYHDSFRRILKPASTTSSTLHANAVRVFSSPSRNFIFYFTCHSLSGDSAPPSFSPQSVTKHTMPSSGHAPFTVIG